MASTWLPADIAEICSDQQTHLTQCSSTGFMFLAVMIRLFGGVNYSISYPQKNPYSTKVKQTNKPLFEFNEKCTLLAEHRSSEKSSGNIKFCIDKESTHENINDYLQSQEFLKPHYGMDAFSRIPYYAHNKSIYDLENFKNAFDPSIEMSDIMLNNHGKKETFEESGKYYDFIIVGAGSAGCVLANRLSEVKKWRILLLEAGPEEPDITMIPSMLSTLRASSIDWNYRTQPEPLTCRSIRGKTCGWTRGKTMGGSSAVNYLVYMRGNKRDYDYWAELGNHGWSYNELLPYFKKSENNRAIEANDKHYHGVGGPINVERFSYIDANTIMLVKAFNQTGLPIIDLNKENNIGTNIALSTSKDGRRVSTNIAYIKPIRKIRSNIDIIVNAFATNIIINPETKTAQGVVYVKNGVTYRVLAKKEVIVSSGALNSPKLLMLSGIGPKAHLRALNIPIITDLPVGFNLQDHVTTHGLTIALSNETSTMIKAPKLFQEVQKYYHQKFKKSGPLSTTSILNSVAFIKTKYAREEAPDIQFHFDGRNVEEFYSDPQTYIETNIFPVSFYNGITVRPILLIPKSKGIIMLNNTDPVYGQPLIYSKFFTVKEDMDVMIEGLRYVVSLEETEAFKQNGARYVKTPVKNCEGHIWGSYDYFACLLIEYTTTIYHPVGTCKMGPSSDKEAVVDPRLRVYGVNNLRVVDASIMPFIVRGNTNIPVVTIAERASDLIKEEYLKKNIQH